VLKEADVIIHDYLVDKRLLSEIENAEFISCDTLDKKKYSDGFSKSQGVINNLIIKKANEGKKVVRLKNGDPGIFGRFSQELEVLVKNRIDFEVIPGVTAGNAASSLSGIPLTDRRFASNCVFVTGHEDPMKEKSLVDWAALATSGTIVLYMAVENLKQIVKKLLEIGKARSTPCTVVQEVSLLNQRIVRGILGNIAKKAKEKKIKAPTVIIIGEVARLEKDFNWLKKKKKILFTGLSNERFFTDEVYFHLPLIKIVPLDSYSEFDKQIKNIKRFDWIVFTSRYGVKYFFKRLIKIKSDARTLENIKIAAIGDSTKKALLDFGVIADLVPEKESSKGLLEEFKKVDLEGKKIFMPRSDLSDKNLSVGFKNLGAVVTSTKAYKNIMPQNLPELELENFDEIMFTSPSTARNFKKRYKHVPKGVRVQCIGDVTLKEVQKLGLK